MTTTKRREFLKTAGAGAVALTMANDVATAAANEQITVGVIGPGGMGSAHTRLLAARNDVQVKYVCDETCESIAIAPDHFKQPCRFSRVLTPCFLK